jgi:hypothetical protein
MLRADAYEQNEHERDPLRRLARGEQLPERPVPGSGNSGWPEISSIDHVYGGTPPVANTVCE